MKRFIPCGITAVCFIILVTTGCEKDNEEAAFIGVWDLKLIHKDAYVNSVFRGDTTIRYDAGELILQINENNTGFKYENGTGNSFTWSVNGNIISVIFPFQSPLHLDFLVDEESFFFIVSDFKYYNYPSAGDIYEEVWYHWAERIQSFDTEK